MSYGVEQLRADLESSPFCRLLDLDVREYAPEDKRLVLVMPYSEPLGRLAEGEQFHGGAVAAFVDTVADFAVAILVGGGVPTANFRIDFLRPSVGRELTGEAVVRKLGRTLSVVDVNVTTPDGRVCAVGRGTYMTQVG